MCFCYYIVLIGLVGFGVCVGVFCVLFGLCLFWVGYSYCWDWIRLLVVIVIDIVYIVVLLIVVLSFVGFIIGFWCCGCLVCLVS